MTQMHVDTNQYPLTDEAFASMGEDRFVYARPLSMQEFAHNHPDVDIPGNIEKLFALYAADGTMILVTVGLFEAKTMAQDYELDLLSVH